MDQNQSLVSVIAILLIVGAGIAVYWNVFRGGGAQVPTEAWYYDTVTEEYFTADSNELPPFINGDGNPSVRVRRYTCGECTEEEMFVGWYERYPPEVRDRLAEAQEEGDYGAIIDLQQGLQYSADAENWFPSQGPQARRMMMSERLQCEDGSRADSCRAD
jgi:hypothetical protein